MSTNSSTYDKYFTDFVDCLDDLQECMIKSTEAELRKFETSIGDVSAQEYKNEFTVPYGVRLPIEVLKNVQDKTSSVTSNITVDVAKDLMDKLFKTNKLRYKRFQDRYEPNFNKPLEWKSKDSFNVHFTLKKSY